MHRVHHFLCCNSPTRKQHSSILLRAFFISTVVENVSYPGGKRFLPRWKMIFTKVRQDFAAYRFTETLIVISNLQAFSKKT
jgi:hypothetical protein